MADCYAGPACFTQVDQSWSAPEGTGILQDAYMLVTAALLIVLIKCCSLSRVEISKGLHGAEHTS